MEYMAERQKPRLTYIYTNIQKPILTACKACMFFESNISFAEYLYKHLQSITVWLVFNITMNNFFSF